MNKKIAITLGDPAGIGPEILVKAIARLTSPERKRLLVIGSESILEKIKGYNKIRKSIEIIDLDNLDADGFTVGKASTACARAALDYLDEAISLVKKGEAEAMVTCPVNKFAIDQVSRGFCGQTEYIGRAFRAKSVRMMILSSKLKFTLVTTHVSLAQACQLLSQENLAQTIILTAVDLERLFAVKRAKIGVCGLNPHMGENGLIGREEIDIIRPAIEDAGKSLKKSKIYGPLALEKIVHSLLEGSLSAGICLYHDQAILPLKLLCPGKGVNMTLGLGFVRTSPLHGTAFDIAGKNKADCSSLLEAIRLTLDLTKRI